MRQSVGFFPTLREVPKEAEAKSHILMLRAGLIRQLAAGMYIYLPLGWRALRKVEQIIREEMDRAGALEVLMPTLQPDQLWKESGRWEVMGPEMMRLKDRNEREFVLGPTHEEVITHLVVVKSAPIAICQKICIRYKPSSGMKSVPVSAWCGHGNSS